MKTGIPCAHILTGKTYFNAIENLLSLQGTYFQKKFGLIFLRFPLVGVPAGAKVCPGVHRFWQIKI